MDPCQRKVALTPPARCIISLSEKSKGARFSMMIRTGRGAGRFLTASKGSTCLLSYPFSAWRGFINLWKGGGGSAGYRPLGRLPCGERAEKDEELIAAGEAVRELL